MSRSYKRYPVHVKKKRQQLKRYIIAKSVALLILLMVVSIKGLRNDTIFTIGDFARLVM